MGSGLNPFADTTWHKMSDHSFRNEIRKLNKQVCTLLAEKKHRNYRRVYSFSKEQYK